MVKLNETSIEEYLIKYGWEFFRDDEIHTLRPVWRTGWKTETRTYPLSITLTDTWVLFEVKPFMKFECDCLFEDKQFYKFLLELNSEIQLVKVYVDECGQIVLSAQFFSNLSYEEFSNTLGILSYYCDLIYNMLMDLNGEPQDFEGYYDMIS